MVDLVSELGNYVSDFKDFFRSKTRTCYSGALHYAEGLFKCPKKKATCTGISDELPGTHSQSLNHMLSDSKWDYQLVYDEIANRCSDFYESLGARPDDVALIVDEVGFPKKGKQSACVGHQYLGCLGKHENGQVAVGLGLGLNKHYSLINMRMFMPESWEKDLERRKKAKIPDSIVHQTKSELALEMIKKAKREGVRFGWVGFDSLYGNNWGLLDDLDKLGLTFMGDIKSTARIFLEDPDPYVPERKSKMGIAPRKFRTDVPGQKVNEYIKTLEDEDWDLITFRAGTKGDMQAWFHRKTVWVWAHARNPKAQRYTLIIRKDREGEDIKFSLTNADGHTPTERLAFMQGQRYLVEQGFKEGKNQVGLGDYQVRSWDGFHKHMAISILALNFLMEQKARFQTVLPYITAEDIRSFIEFLLPNKIQTIEQKVNALLKKHRHYQRQIQQRRKRRT